MRQTAAAHPDVPHTDIEQLAESVRQKQRRRTTVPLDETIELILTAREHADVLVMTHFRKDVRERTRTALAKHLKTLPPHDRLILQLQFESGMHISDIARRLGVDQKPLYRRREQLFRDLRSALEKDGISAEDIRDLLAHPDDE